MGVAMVSGRGRNSGRDTTPIRHSCGRGCSEMLLLCEKMMFYTRVTLIRWGKGSVMCKVSFLVTCGFFKALATLVLQTEATRAQKSTLHTTDPFPHLIPATLV